MIFSSDGRFGPLESRQITARAREEKITKPKLHLSTGPDYKDTLSRPIDIIRPSLAAALNPLQFRRAKAPKRAPIEIFDDLQWQIRRLFEPRVYDDRVLRSININEARAPLFLLCSASSSALRRLANQKRRARDTRSSRAPRKKGKKARERSTVRTSSKSAPKQSMPNV